MMIADILALSLSIAAGNITLAPDSLEKKQSEPYQLIHHLSVTSGIDYVAPSVEDDIREKIPRDEKINVNTSIPLNFRYSFSFTDPHIRNFLPGGYQGIGIGVLNFGAAQSHGFCKARHNIGYPIMVYVFQGGPFKHFNSGLSLDYEWNFGAAIGWKPYSEVNKYFNLTVGSKVNAYLNLSLLLRWQVNDRFGLFGGLAVSHFSNGNTSFPNPGVNSLGIRVGMEYTINPQVAPEEELLPDTIQHKKPEYDISIWASTRKRVYRGGENPVLMPGHFACAGISFAPMARLNRWWRVGGSLDFQYDHSAGMPKGLEPDQLPARVPFFKQTSLGVSAHGELQMPLFAVNVGIGYNILAPWENKGSYQNITLKTYFCRYVFLNIGYQLRNFHQQSSLMLGLGVSL